MHHEHDEGISDRWPHMHLQGDRSHLSRKLLGILWSSECPGTYATRAIKAVPEIRDSGVAVASGFDSSMDSLVVELLLEGKQPVVVCFSKALRCYGLPVHWKKAIDEGRLLLICPFSDSVRRISKAGRRSRNEFVAAVSSAIFIAYISAKDSTQAVAQEFIASGKPLFTFGGRENQSLLKCGARRYDIDEVRRFTIGA